MDTIFDRVLKAAMLDVEFFNEVEADESLTSEAFMVVLIVSLVSGIGSFIASLMVGRFGRAILALFVAVILGVVNYYIWAYLTHFIGESLFEATSTPGETLRVLGYASGPRVLGLLVFIPCLGQIINLGGAVWSLAAGFIGVREALDLDNGKTLATVIIGWVLILIINLVIGGILGVGSLGVGAASSVLGR